MNPFPRLTRLLLTLLYTAGGLSGVFLLLCALGILSPEGIGAWLGREVEPTPAQQAVLSTEVTETVDKPFQVIPLPLTQLDQAGEAAGEGKSLLLAMKAEDGSLGYISALPLAADCGASSGVAQRNQALWQLNQREGVYTIAQVSCLRDGTLANYDRRLALCRPSGSVWRDPDKLAWLDPTEEGVQDYLIGICTELAQLGFDEILLTNCAYPTQGDLASLGETGDRDAQLEAFCRRLQGALADYPVLVSIQGSGDFAQKGSQSGQTAALLASFPGRVWAGQGDAEALAAFRPVVLP